MIVIFPFTLFSQWIYTQYIYMIFELDRESEYIHNTLSLHLIFTTEQDYPNLYILHSIIGNTFLI